MGAAEFRVFFMSDKHDRRYVSFRVACGFNCVALIFERAGGGASKSGPPLAARNSSSVHGTTPDKGSLL